MDEYIPTKKEKILDLLFDTTFGSICCFLICLVLFFLMFGIGYLAFGVLLLLKSIDKNERTGNHYRGGSSGFGVIFLWPIVLLLMILDED